MFKSWVWVVFLLLIGLTGTRAGAAPKEDLETEVPVQSLPQPLARPLEIGERESQTTLHIIAVGINHYPKLEGNFSLQSARSDAEEFAKALTRAGETVYGRVNTQVLLDDEATRANIEACFALVRARAKPGDAFTFHYAGYDGKASDGTYFLVPSDATSLRDGAALQQTGITAAQLKVWCAQIPASRQLIVLDACFSGRAFESFVSSAVETDPLAQQLLERDVTILSSQGVAYESNKIKHGVITYTLLRGLEGAADGGDGLITAHDLESYLAGEIGRVSVRAQGRNAMQRAKSYVIGEDFALARIAPVTPEGTRGDKRGAPRLERGDALAPPTVALLQDRRDYALLVATDQYDDAATFPRLRYPVRDARLLRDELEKRYGFAVELLENPTKKQVAQALLTLSQRAYNAGDQVFLFFAGHGDFHRRMKFGSLAFKDSHGNDPARDSHLWQAQLRTMIDNIPCAHVFVALDLCYGGTFDPKIAVERDWGGEAPRAVAAWPHEAGFRLLNFQPVVTDLDLDEFLGRKLARRTRKYLASGGRVAVPDRSAFLDYFLRALQKPDEMGVVTYEDIKRAVGRAPSIEPRGADFGDSARDSEGDFVFVAKPARKK